MPRCCVPGCKSGNYNDLKKYHEAGLSQKAFFGFPKCKILLKKWIDRLNIKTFKPGDQVCEVHFKESDIQRYDQFHLKDGSIHKTARVCCKLRKDAVPMLFSNINCSSIEDESTQGFEENAFEEASEEEVIIGSKTDSEQINYTFRELAKDLKDEVLVMPPHWAFTLKENSSVTFTSVDVKNDKILLFCIVYENMDIQIVTHDRRIAVDVNLRFHSSKEVLDYLENISKLYSCEGVGFNDRYSEFCVGFILPTDRENDNEYFRCPACETFRQHIIEKKLSKGQQMKNFIKKREVDDDNQVIRYELESSKLSDIGSNNETVFVYY